MFKEEEKMRIHVKRGAVIHLFINSHGNYNFEGAVLDINDNEIVLQPQQYVANEYLTKRDSQRFLNSESLRSDITVDAPVPPLHISRSIIIGWCYCSTTFDENTSYGGYILSSEIGDSTIRHYTIDRICDGNGDFFE